MFQDEQRVIQVAFGDVTGSGYAGEYYYGETLLAFRWNVERGDFTDDIWIVQEGDTYREATRAEYDEITTNNAPLGNIQGRLKCC